MNKLTTQQAGKIFLFLLVTNQTVWIALAKKQADDYRKLLRRNQKLNEFGTILSRLIHENNPDLFNDPELVSFLMDHEFEEIVGLI